MHRIRVGTCIQVTSERMRRWLHTSIGRELFGYDDEPMLVASSIGKASVASSGGCHAIEKRMLHDTT